MQNVQVRTGPNSKLMPGFEAPIPHQLNNRAAQSFRGADTYGIGFIFSDDDAIAGAGNRADAEALIRSDPRNAEIVHPYLGGDEITTSPTHAASRFAINFRNLDLDQAKQWPILLSIVESKVKPDRQKIGGYAVAERRKKYWWQYGTDTPALREEASRFSSVIVISQTTAHICFAMAPSRIIFSQKAIVIASPFVMGTFCSVQSRVHMMWALYWGSRQGATPVYSPSDCFETFPFPADYETDPALESAGQTYHDHRAALMIEANEGMTKTYNRFHKPEERSPAILRLRELHDAMDQAVLRAYGWDDLAETLRPEFLTPETEDDHTYQGRYFWNAEGRDLVLSRLLALNAERHAEEVAAGLVPTKGRRATAEDDDGEDEGLFG